jgi:DNA invertase Pin-like site-specific DNA recombinase
MIISKKEAFYARQSIDRPESDSIETQIEKCKEKSEGGDFEEYKDRGYSGKDTDRPAFQKLMQDIKAGLVSKVIVYKLDRISRSVIDFANLMKLFEEHKVEFISATQQNFDTTNPFGRAMLSITMVFAQLERENIRERIIDAYHSGIPKGYRMGGATPYGFDTEPYIIQGKTTKRFVVIPEQADYIKKMYKMYADPRTSLSDIARALTAQGYKTLSGELPFSHTITNTLCNPAYVMADLDIYEFFKSQGVNIVNGVEDFVGTNGCYYYQGRGIKGNKYRDMQGNTLVIAPHEGFIPSDLWLKVRKRLLASATYQPARKAKHSWLGGKTRCGHCGSAVRVGEKYLYCKLRTTHKNECKGCGSTKTEELHKYIYDEMVNELRAYKTLTNPETASKANPKLKAKQLELATVEAKIENLVDSLAIKKTKLSAFLEAKVDELVEQREALMREISALSLDTIPTAQVDVISNHLDLWEDLSLEDKQKVVDFLIKRIRIKSASIEIDWKI